MSIKIDKFLLIKVIHILDKYYDNPIFTLNTLKLMIGSQQKIIMNKLILYDNIMGDVDFRFLDTASLEEKYWPTHYFDLMILRYILRINQGKDKYFKLTNEKQYEQHISK